MLRDLSHASCAVWLVFGLCGVLLILGLSRSASATPIDPVAAGTIRDNPVDGSPDYLDDANDGGGFFGSVTNHSSFVDVFVAEFDLSGFTSVASATLAFDVLGWNSAALAEPIDIGGYSGDGSVTFPDFSPALTAVGSVVLPIDVALLDTLTLDITSFVSGNLGTTVGLHFSLPNLGQVIVGGFSLAQGIDSAPRLLIVIPEPHTSLLLGVGLVGIAATRRRFATYW